MTYKRIKLNYEFDSLEPYFDKKTMEIHYEKHHKGYETKLNEIISGTIEEKKYPELIDLIKNYQNIERHDLKIAVRQFGGGLINHNFFFNHLKIGTNLKEGKLLNAINEKFGSLEEMKEEFKKNALSLFGSGWLWLALTKKGQMKIVMTFNQDNPWFHGFRPIFGLDLWEHSYYLKYQSSRGDYVDNFWNVIDWNKAEENFA